MDAVAGAYSVRSGEYRDALGSVEQMDPVDAALIRRWGSGVSGPILDAGCGPGHWTDFLARGVRGPVAGIDLSPAFIESARTRFPGINFSVMDMGNTEFGDGAFGGVLAWYSLIHAPVSAYPEVLAEFARLLAPGGRLLMGGFRGDHGQAFDHAIARAFFVGELEMVQCLESAGFLVEEIHTRTSPRHRDHLAIVARRP